MGEPSTHTINNSVEVQAEQLEEDRSVVTPNGPVEGKAGHWAVEYPDGRVQVMTDEEWQGVQSGDKDKDKDKSTGVKGTDEDEDKGVTAFQPESEKEKSSTEESTGEKETETEPATPEKTSRSSSRTLDDRL